MKRLNEQVKRNIVRFPEDFMFQLTTEEDEILKSQIATSRNEDFSKSQFATLNENGNKREMENANPLRYKVGRVWKKLLPLRAKRWMCT